MANGFTIKCNNCDSNNVSITSWDRSYDTNIIEIECHDCRQMLIDNAIVKEGK